MADGERKKASVCYEKAKRINRNDYRAYYALAKLFSLNINDSLCQFYFKRAISLQYVIIILIIHSLL